MIFSIVIGQPKHLKFKNSNKVFLDICKSKELCNIILNIYTREMCRKKHINIGKISEILI